MNEAMAMAGRRAGQVVRNALPATNLSLFVGVTLARPENAVRVTKREVLLARVRRLRYAAVESVSVSLPAHATSRGGVAP